MSIDGTLLLGRRDVAELLTVDECLGAVEHAFKLYGEGAVPKPGILSAHCPDGAFHIKAGLLTLERPYFVVKTNGNFFQNSRRFGLPNIQGIILLCDAETGSPLALMDSIEITIRRTGAATAVAAKYLSRTDSKTMTICGGGNQGRISLEMILRVRPAIERVYVYDIDADQAARFARELSGQLQIEIEATDDLARALGQSDICVTCTPSRTHFINREDVAPGTFVAGVGADSEEKHELDPQLLAANKVVVDILDQCASIGDLHHALDAGLMTRAGVHAELGEVVAGRKQGRGSAAEIIIFDSTGMALQDAATAIVIYEKAVAANRGDKLNFAQ